MSLLLSTDARLRERRQQRITGRRLARIALTDRRANAWARFRSTKISVIDEDLAVLAAGRIDELPFASREMTEIWRQIFAVDLDERRAKGSIGPRERAETRHDLARKLDAFRTDYNLPPLDEVIAEAHEVGRCFERMPAPPGSVLIDLYHVEGDEWIVFGIPAGADRPEVHVTVNLPARAMSGVGAPVHAGTVEAHLQLGAEVATRLLQPLLKAIQGVLTPGAPVVICPDGRASALPFSLVLNMGSPLGVEHPMLVVPSPASVASPTPYSLGRDRHQQSVLMAPNPFGDLCWSRSEVLACANALPGRPSVLLDRKATRSALLSQRAPSYLSLATHGALHPVDPLASHLALHGGAVTAADLAIDLDLVNTQLIILSACSIGAAHSASDHDEFSGFPALFLTAGTRYVVGATLPVPDLPTALLMADFTRTLERHPPEQALRQVLRDLRGLSTSDVRDRVHSSIIAVETDRRQRETLERHLKAALYSLGDQPFQHPLCWGGWTVYGAPSLA